MNLPEAPLDSAIPAHLRCPRTRELRASEAYTPPNPAYSARLDPSVKQVVMAYFGAQYRCAAGRQAAREGLDFLRHAATQPDGPQHHDLAFTIDVAGYDTFVWAAYWTDPASFERWQRGEELSRWWNSGERLEGRCGWFCEVAKPEVERFETLFSTADRPEGMAFLAPSMSGEIREHAYWGSMRDRLPASQTDALRGSGGSATPMPGRRVAVGGFDNLALIRSGQDWSDTQGEERRLYLQQIEPKLREGMDFLRDSGLDVGCLSSRYLVHVDEDLSPVERSYGLSWWRDLACMERWSQNHQTHLEIFGAFMRMVQQLKFKVDLRLYHEVCVLPAACQRFEYINCHANTGLLRPLHGRHAQDEHAPPTGPRQHAVLNASAAIGADPIRS